MNHFAASKRWRTRYSRSSGFIIAFPCRGSNQDHKFAIPFLAAFLAPEFPTSRQPARRKACLYSARPAAGEPSYFLRVNQKSFLRISPQWPID